MGFVNKRNGNTMRPVAEDRDFLVVPTLPLLEDDEAVVFVVIEIVVAIFDDCGDDDAAVVVNDDVDWIGWATIVWLKWFAVDVGAANDDVDDNGDSEDDGASLSLNEINWPAEAYCTGTLLRRRLEIETFSND